MLDSTQAARACVDRASRTLVGRAGLIRSLRHDPPSPVDPPVFKVIPQPPRTRLYTGLDVKVESCGMAMTQPEAEAAAVGEFLERYCGGTYELAALQRATELELGDEAIPFASLGLYAPEQYDDPRFPFERPRADAPRRWVPGRWLPDGKRCLVPACAVYVPYATDSRQDFLTPSVSTGQACHVEEAAAVLSGLYEVVERDAFALTWLHRFQAPQVDVVSEGLTAELFRAGVDVERLRIAIFDITTDIGIPVMLCLTEGRSRRGPLWGVGACARLDARVAARKAMIEAVADIRYARGLLEARPDWRPLPDYSNVESFADHVRLYCEPSMGEHLEFLWRSQARTPLGAPRTPRPARQELDSALERLASVGLRALSVDITTADVASAGFCCQKVFVPGAVSLTAIHKVPSLGSPRLRSVPRALGWKLSGELNPIPHPFP